MESKLLPTVLGDSIIITEMAVVEKSGKIILMLRRQV